MARPRIALALPLVLGPSLALAQTPDRPLLGEPHRTLPADDEYAADVELLDVEGDGDLDIVFAGIGEIELRINDGLGVFSRGQLLELAPNTGVYSVEVADFDGDGSPDLFFGGADEDHVWLNDGAGTFVLGSPVPSSTNESYAVAAADVDGDGDVDVFCGHVSGADQLFLNDGNANFSNASGQIPTRTGVTTYARFGDVDGDGDPDLMLGFNDVVLWVNDGAGTFVDSASIAGYALPALFDAHDVVLGDVDGDTDVDVLVARSASNSLWLNDGSGNFANAAGQLPQHAEMTSEIELGDIDGDGDLDAFSLNITQCGATGGCASPVGGQDHVYLNDGSGNFSEGPLPPTETEVDRRVALGDVDGDGDVDVVISTDPIRSKNDRLYLGDGAGGFVDVTEDGVFPFLDDFAYCAQSIDVDGDGDEDLLIGVFGRDRLLLNRLPRPWLDASATMPLGGNIATHDVAVGDVDGDGDEDAVVAQFSTGANHGLLRNDAGVLVNASSQIPGVGTKNLAVVLVDVDGDDDLDAVFGTSSSTPCHLHLNDGLGNFVAGPALPVSGGSVEELVASDVDADGDQDLLVASDTEILLWRNDGSGVFTNDPAAIPAGFGGVESFATADFDGDGFLDFVSDAKSGPNQLAFNDGTGSFTDESARLPSNKLPGFYDTAVTMDVDADGDVDITFFGNAGSVALNDGAGNFTDGTALVPPLFWSARDARAVADLDLDGDEDVLVGNTFEGYRILTNLSFHVAWHNPPVVGRLSRIDAYGRPGSTALLAFSTEGTRVVLPIGVLGLAPGTLRIAGSIGLGGTGAGSIQAVIPSDPTLVGLVLYWQAYFPVEARLSNLDRMTILGD